MVERLLITCDENEPITIEDLPENFCSKNIRDNSILNLNIPLKEYLKEKEKLYLLEVLKYYSNKTEAAEKIGISRRALYQKIDEFGLNK